MGLEHVGLLANGMGMMVFKWPRHVQTGHGIILFFQMTEMLQF